MEHPYLFFVKLFELLGLSHFAHTYPHVIYSWVTMIILIILGFIAAKGISLIPTKAQNVMEIIISGIEEFMIDITGEIPRPGGNTEIPACDSQVPSARSVSWQTCR